MARLSEQQRRILGFCWERFEGGAEYVLFLDLLAYLHPDWPREFETTKVGEYGQTWSEPAFRQFDVAVIGEAAYRTARASLTRSLRRLERDEHLVRTTVEVPGSHGIPFERSAVRLCGFPNGRSVSEQAGKHRCQQDIAGPAKDP